MAPGLGISRWGACRAPERAGVPRSALDCCAAPERVDERWVSEVWFIIIRARLKHGVRAK